MMPVPIPIYQDKNTQAKDKVIKFTSWEEAESCLRSILPKLLGSTVEFDFESGKIRYTDTDGERQKDRLEYNWRILKDSFYMSFYVLDSDGHANLLEIAVVEELLKDGT